MWYLGPRTVSEKIEVRGRLPREAKIFEAGQDLLESEGIVGSGLRVSKNTTLMNHYVPNSVQPDPNNIDVKKAFLRYSLHDPAYVDRVAMTTTRDEMTLVKVLLRQTRVPERGDKFSSRHGQKGYCSMQLISIQYKDSHYKNFRILRIK